MSPDAARTMLKGMLETNGLDVTLRRRIGTSTTNFQEVQCRMAIRSNSASELLSGITQQSEVLIMSQDEILAAGWPGNAGGPAWPRKGDIVIGAGADRTVQRAEPHYMQNEIVRIDGQFLG